MLEQKQYVPSSEEVPPKVDAPPFLPEPKPRGQPGFELLLYYILLYYYIIISYYILLYRQPGFSWGAVNVERTNVVPRPLQLGPADNKPLMKTKISWSFMERLIMFSNTPQRQLVHRVWIQCDKRKRVRLAILFSNLVEREHLQDIFDRNSAEDVLYIHVIVYVVIHWSFLNW